jgi:hypothetical protein
MLRLLAYCMIVQAVLLTGAFAVELFFVGEPVAVSSTVIVDQTTSETDCLPPRAWVRTTLGSVCQ